MIAHVVACDYDGTIAEESRVSHATATALARVRQSGRKLVLVTGRMLPDLQTVCPDLDRMFDAVVAENGAALYLPETRDVTILGDDPEPSLLDALRRHRVEFNVGRSVIASTVRFAEPALAAIRDAGVERTLIFNKGAMMLLPGGITKGTGLDAALDALELSVHNLVGIGDAENDHAFLSRCECGVAVADAVPALRERADYVTRSPAARGVVEFLDAHVLNDLADVLPRMTRHHIALGERADRTPLTIGAHGTRLLIVGPAGSGKSTVTGVLVGRLAESGRTFCVLDPEGNHQSLAELTSVLVLGGKGKGERALPTAEELDQLLRHPHTSLVLNLAAMTRAEKVDYATGALGTVGAVRSTHGLPHWVIVDEAHHLFPAEGSTASELIGAGTAPLCLITLSATDLARGVRSLPNALVATEVTAFRAALRIVRRESADRVAGLDGGSINRGEALFAGLGEGGVRVEQFNVARR